MLIEELMEFSTMVPPALRVWLKTWVPVPEHSRVEGPNVHEIRETEILENTNSRCMTEMGLSEYMSDRFSKRSVAALAEFNTTVG